MTGQVTGQRHDHNRPHPPERLATMVAEATRYRGGLISISVDAIDIALRAPIDVPGLGSILVHEYQIAVSSSSAKNEHGEAAALMSTLAAGDDPPPLPIALSLAPDGQDVVWLRTRRQWKALRDAWRERKVSIHSRAALAVRDAHNQIDVVVGVTPVVGDDGQALPGLPALEGLVARETLWASVKATYFRPDALAAHIAALAHPAPGTLATDVPTARAQLMDRLDAAAEETRRWLLDDDTGLGAGPATVGQEAELRRLEERRQKGRQDLRAATTHSTLLATATAAIALVEGIGIEDAPVWQTGSSGTTITGRRYSATYTAGADGDPWILRLRAVNPSQTIASKPAAALGAVVLDEVSPPAGWTVTSAPRAAPAAHERDVTVTWNGAGEPDTGSYAIPLTARNTCGPRDLAVTITVPAATPAPTEEASS